MGRSTELAIAESCGAEATPKLLSSGKAGAPRQFLQPLGEPAQPLHPLGVVLVAVIHPGDARNHVPEHRLCHVARTPHCSQQRIRQ